MNTQKDYLTDLVDEIDGDNQEQEITQEIDDNMAISEEGEIIELDY